MAGQEWVRRPARVSNLWFAVLAALWLTGLAPVARADAGPVPFDIPAQPLAGALNSWAVQANAQVFFEEAPVAGLSAPAVTGTMAPVQALQALLAHSNLEFVRNADGAYLVRPKARVVHHRAPQPVQAAAAPAAPATPVPVAPAMVRSAREEEGAWLVRMRGEWLLPAQRSDAAALPTSPASEVPRNGQHVAGGGSGELALEYFMDSNWSAELGIGAPMSHDLSIHGGSYPNGTVGEFRLQPGFALVKYSLSPETTFRPYVGLGASLTAYYGVSAAPFGLSHLTLGPAAQLGADLHLSRHWVVNADLKWDRARPGVSFAGQRVGQLQIDPFWFGIGVGYRFGGDAP
jgi:outer membrane protein